VATGEVKLNERLLQAGDGAAITNETEIAIAGHGLDSKILLFDLAK
jgi:quercetin 2,3-dioxygenase